MKNIKSPLVFITFLFILSIGGSNHAQNTKIDSLEGVLKLHKEQDTIRVNLLNTIAEKSLRLNKEKSLEYSKEAADLSEQLRFLKGKANSFYSLGRYWYGTDFDKALEYFQDALKVSVKIKNKELILKCNNATAIVYSIQGDFFNAISHYQDALKIAEELNDKNKFHSLYNNLAGVHGTLKDFEKALYYSKKALEISKENNNKTNIAQANSSIGALYESLNDYDQALIYYQKALEILLEFNDEGMDISLVYLRLGGIYNILGDNVKALEYLQFANDYNKKTGNALNAVRINEKMGIIKFDQNNYNDAYFYSKKVYDQATLSGHLVLQLGGANLLSKSSKELGNYKEAYKYQVIYKTLSDSVFNEDNVREINTLENQYKFNAELKERELAQEKIDLIKKEEEKYQQIIRNSFIIGFLLLLVLVLVVMRSVVQKRKTNETLFRQNEEIQKQSKKLDESNNQLKDLIATKDKFFTIISHDLRNPFNALIGFSDILVENNKNYDEKQREKYLKIINETAKKTFQLLSNLLTWSKTQTGGIQFKPEELNVKIIIDEIINSKDDVALLKNVELKSEIDTTLSVYADKNMLDTIIRNLLSNAIKFTEKGGKVTITASLVNLTGNETNVKIAIKDTGVGITSKLQSKIFNITGNTSKSGTENEKGTGLGLILCKEFVDWHKGEIEVESEIGKGSTFYITLPL